MSNSIVRASFETKLKTWADAQTPKIPIAFQGVSFTKPADGSPYLETFLIPNDTLNLELSGKRETYIGLFQINCWAQSGKGMGAVETLAQKVIDLFPILPKIGTISIEKTPSATRPLLDEAGWLVVPVTIRYRMEA